MGEGARLATRAELFVETGALGWPGAVADGPLIPVLAAPAVFLGASPTGSLRLLALLLGALVAPLVLGVGFRLGVPAGRAVVAGVLAVASPLLVSHAGGPALASAGAATTLLLLVLVLLSASGRRPRRIGGMLLALLPLADPLLAAYLPALLIVCLRREERARTRALILGLVVAALLFAPLPSLDGEASGLLLRLAAAGVWAVLACAGILLFAVPAGLARLYRSENPLGPAWLVGAGLHLTLLLLLPLAPAPAPGWEGFPQATPLVPLLLLAGLVAVPAVRWRKVRMVALTLSAAGGIFVLSGPLQIFLRPNAPLAAGRAHRLARAAQAATTAAGPQGWIAFDLRPGRRLEEKRLADRVGNRVVGRLRPRSDEGQRPALPALPLADLPAATPVGAVIRYRPEILEVSTEGGTGIYIREPTARYGPWLILRLTRP